MTSPPRLALLIPAYNAARFLPRLLQSAHQQTEPFDEIWVHDDGSTDDTAAVAAANGAQVVRSQANRGCSAGKNLLAQRTTAEWLHFHDADDELKPHFAELARKRMAHDTFDIILFDYEYRDNQTNALLGITRFDRRALEADARRYAIVQQINPFCGLYRRKTFLEAGGWDEDPLVLYNEDVAFHIRMAFAGLRFSAENEVSVINYRVTGSMSSDSQARCALAQCHVMRKTWQRSDAKRYSKEIGQQLWKIGGVLGAVGAWREACEAATLAASICPPDRNVGKLWFRALAAASPSAAILLREAVIRVLKSHLRRSTGAGSRA